MKKDLQFTLIVCDVSETEAGAMVEALVTLGAVIATTHNCALDMEALETPAPDPSVN